MGAPGCFDDEMYPGARRESVKMPIAATAYRDGLFGANRRIQNNKAIMQTF
jgi:hypothetical protein